MVALNLFFILVVTPLGVILRIAGKDLLQLKKAGKGETYWNAAKESGPLDRLF